MTTPATKIRLEHDAERLLAFLASNDYPCPWTLEGLADDVSIKLRVERGGDVAAYVWGNWVDDDLTLEFHACAAIGRSWLTREVLANLFRVAELLGARRLTTNTIGPRAVPIRALLRRYGFADDGEHLKLELED